MFVAMPYFVFMEAMVPCLIDCEKTSEVWNQRFLLYIAVWLARVRMACVCPMAQSQARLGRRTMYFVQICDSN